VIALADVMREKQLSVRVQREPHVLVAILGRIIGLQPLLLLRAKRPCFVGLDMLRSHVNQLRFKQPLALLAERDEQTQDRRLVNARHARDSADAHTFGQELEDLLGGLKARCVCAERIRGLSFSEGGAAVAATIAARSGGCLPESLGCSVFALPAGHDRPLARNAGRADNQVEVWTVRP
jgi:hypothetical protein